MIHYLVKLKTDGKVKIQICKEIKSFCVDMTNEDARNPNSRLRHQHEKTSTRCIFCKVAGIKHK